MGGKRSAYLTTCMYVHVVSRMFARSNRCQDSLLRDLDVWESGIGGGEGERGLFRVRLGMRLRLCRGG